MKIKSIEELKKDSIFGAKLKLWIEKRQEVVLRLEELKKAFSDIGAVKDKVALIELERAKADIKQVYLSMPVFYDIPQLFKEEEQDIAEKLKELEIL